MTIYKIPVFIILLLLPFFAIAQEQPTHKQSLITYEDTLSGLADKMINNDTAAVRERSCYRFIRTLVTALKIKGSFNYPFTNIKNILINYPKDNSFRILSWGLLRDNGTNRYYGCIQLKRKDSLLLYPIFDNSELLKNPEDTIVNNEGWYGALYYNILQKRKSLFKKQYFLFGLNQNSYNTTKKVLDVLHFENGKPYFGAPVFIYKGKEKEKKYRVIIEYKKDAAVSLNYSPELKKITYDHLIPLNPLYKTLRHTHVPDGSYQGFKYKWWRWVYIDKIFHQTFEEAPIPKPKGND